MAPATSRFHVRLLVEVIVFVFCNELVGAALPPFRGALEPGEPHLRGGGPFSLGRGLGHVVVCFFKSVITSV